MRRIFIKLAAAGIFAGLGSIAGAATMTMDGTISDNMCGTSHSKMMDMHKEAKMTEKDCTMACVQHGGQFVFVSGGKVYNVANQKLAALTENAGSTVSLTGDFGGDTVTVKKISVKK
jgi:hypothetical protein